MSTARTARDRSAACTCRRLLLDGAELDKPRVHWRFRLVDAHGDAQTYLHASSFDLACQAMPLSHIFHTPTAGFSVYDLPDAEPDEVTLGLPHGVTREQLEERIGEELMRQMLGLQYAIESMDIREAHNAAGRSPRRPA